MDFERLYEYRFRDVDPEARAVVWGAIASWVWERFGRPERVLDPAAGLGEFIAAVPAPERWAVDMVDHGLRRIPGIEVRIDSFFDVDLPSAHFDLIFVSNLLEHLADQMEIARFLGVVRGLLRPGGRVVVVGPNFRYCADEYFDCADHVIPLTHVSVSEHLYAAGFEIGVTRGRFLPYSFRSRLPASRRLAATYLRLPALWRFFGKQFLVEGIRAD